MVALTRSPLGTFRLTSIWSPPNVWEEELLELEVLLLDELELPELFFFAEEPEEFFFLVPDEPEELFLGVEFREEERELFLEEEELFFGALLEVEAEVFAVGEVAVNAKADAAGRETVITAAIIVAAILFAVFHFPYWVSEIDFIVNLSLLFNQL